MDVHRTLVLPKYVWGLARCRIEQDDKFEEMWAKNGRRDQVCFFITLHVTPEYIVVVSNPSEIVVDEDGSELTLPLRGYIATKRASRE